MRQEGEEERQQARVGWYAFTHAICGSSGLFSSVWWPSRWSFTTIHKHWTRSRSQTFPETHQEGTAAGMKQAIPFFFCSSSLFWPARCVSSASGSYKLWMNPHNVFAYPPACHWKQTDSRFSLEESQTLKEAALKCWLLRSTTLINL